MAVITGARYRTGASAGIAGDTTGYGPYTVAGAPTDGAGGAWVGFAEKGALLLDITNANLYINVNTKASPTWKLFTRAA